MVFNISHDQMLNEFAEATGRMIYDVLPPRTSFVLMVFPTGFGRCRFMTNLNRQEMIGVMEGQLEILRDETRHIEKDLT